jgi:glycerophosphocholine phosphodiesterase GPCPD1
VPVVYHDFQVAITLKRKGHQAELFVVPVKDLTLPQLQSLKIYHASQTDMSKVDEELDEDDQNSLTTIVPDAIDEHAAATHNVDEQQIEKKFRSLFPTLQELFEKLDPHLGFNVEIKYAMEYRQGGSEQNHFFERNEYIDCILRCLMTHGRFVELNDAVRRCLSSSRQTSDRSIDLRSRLCFAVASETDFVSRSLLDAGRQRRLASVS